MMPRVFPNIVRKPSCVSYIFSSRPFCDLVVHNTDDEILCNSQNEDNVGLVSGAVFSPPEALVPNVKMNMDGYRVKAVAVLAYKQMRCRAELSWAHVKTTDDAHIGVSQTTSPSLFLLVGGWARDLEERVSWRLSVCPSLVKGSLSLSLSPPPTLSAFCRVLCSVAKYGMRNSILLACSVRTSVTVSCSTNTLESTQW